MIHRDSEALYETHEHREAFSPKKKSFQDSEKYQNFENIQFVLYVP